MKHIMTRMSALAIALCAAASLSAQGFYDDDIYFNPAKDKDRNVEAAKKAATQKRTNGYILRPVSEYPAADTYVPEGTSNRSVDDYNRRGIFARADSTSRSTDSISATADYAYTRQIEKYYNPDIIVGSSDPEIAQLYYAEPAEVNIYVNTPGYGYWGYPYSYYGGWYDPWYWGTSLWYPYWGPSWSFSWNWGPAWWGPAWGWGGPAWGPSWGWGWTSPGWNWGWVGPRPYNNPRHPGAIRHNHMAGGYSNGYRPAAGSRPSSGYRPTSRPGNNYRPAARPTNNNNYRPSGNTNNRDYNNYTRPGRSNSGATFRSSGGSSNRGGGFSTGGGGGSRSGGGGGRGRH